ncbi:hypothetical protein Hanom_Chr10g00932831 [Helianthus anomalus]
MTFPSLKRYKKPKNIQEYLDLKLKQSESIVTYKSKGNSDKEAQQILSAEFTKVNKLEDFAKNVSQKAFQGLVSNPNLKKELREDYLDFIMKNKPYRASRAKFTGWSVDALLE